MKTHYDVLKLGKSCSAKDIRNAFIKLSKIYHPDKNKSHNAQKKFVEINEAYSVLGKEESRRNYDEIIKSGQKPQHYKCERKSYNHVYHNTYYAQKNGCDQEQEVNLKFQKKIFVMLGFTFAFAFGNLFAIIYRKRQADYRSKVTNYMLKKMEDENRLLSNEEWIEMIANGKVKQMSFTQGKKEYDELQRKRNS